jgi:ribosomal protein S18 acetylase RimI-like enzyme
MKFTRSTDIQSSIDISKAMMLGYYHEYGLEWQPEEYIKALSSSEHYHVFVAGELAGFFAYKLNDDELFLLDMQVLPDFQSQGIGAEIMNSLRSVCAKSNIRSMGLAVFKSNQQAFKFYQTHKFSVYETHKTVFLMRKLLP